MKISKVETFHCDAGWRPWTFVKIETDEGLVGWGECSDSRNAYGLAGCIRDFEPLLLGRDPRAIELRKRTEGATPTRRDPAYLVDTMLGTVGGSPSSEERQSGPPSEPRKTRQG